MTAADREAIRRRAEKATRGPWAWAEDGDFALLNPDLYVKWCDQQYPKDLWPFILQGVWRNDSTAGIACESDHDAEFIAHAREDVPALLAEVARLQGLLDRQNALIEWTLGESLTEEFPPLPEDWPRRKFYWREELRKRWRGAISPSPQEPDK